MKNKITVDFFMNKTTPWITYMIPGAGVLKPEDGLLHAFVNGADFACMGMFDFQVIENVNFTYDIQNSDLKRERNW